MTEAKRGNVIQVTIRGDLVAIHAELDLEGIKRLQTVVESMIRLLQDDEGPAGRRALEEGQG